MGRTRGVGKILVAITGASGMVFIKALLSEFAKLDILIHGVCSTSGRQVLSMELGLSPEALPGIQQWFDEKDFSAPPASGSSGYDGMIILPCSMGTLGAVAGGLSNNLVHRAADVMLKERKKLILAVRETPLNRTHLTNMLAVNDAGGIICPPMPAFYLNPANLDEAAQTYSWKVADLFDLEMPGRRRWEGVKC